LETAACQRGGTRNGPKNRLKQLYFPAVSVPKAGQRDKGHVDEPQGKHDWHIANPNSTDKRKNNTNPMQGQKKKHQKIIQI